MSFGDEREQTLPPGHPGALPSREEPLPPSAAAPRRGLPQPGELVAGYRVERLLGRGGMGAVYVARDPAGREVALKVQTGGRFERFRREAQAIARLDHPGIVKVHSAGCDELGRLFCVLALVPGVALDAALRQRGSLPPLEAAALIQQAAEAMAYAHAEGILHRDLKPANLLLTPQQRVVVTDFGLARVVDQSQRLSETGHLLGTPAYMSPEQAYGKVSEIGPASDVYGLGATLYELLCGRPPFCGMPPIQLLASIVNLEPEPPSTHEAQVPRALDAVVARCLAKDPSARYSSAQALAADLAGFAAEGAAGVQALRDLRPARRRWPLAALGLTGLGGLLGALALAWDGESWDGESWGGVSPGGVSPSVRPEVRAPAEPSLSEGAARRLAPGERARFLVGEEELLRLVLTGAPGARVVIEQGDQTREVSCEPGWDFPVSLSKRGWRPLSAGSGSVRVVADSPGPVEVRLERPGAEEAPLALEGPVLPTVEACFSEGPAREEARQLLRELRKVPLGLKQRVQDSPVARAYLQLGQLDRQAGLPPAKLLLSALGAGAPADLRPAEGPAAVARRLLARGSQLYAVRYHVGADPELAPSEAVEHLQWCREADPRWLVVRERLCLAWAALGDLEAMEREALQLLACAPAHPRAPSLLALAALCRRGTGTLFGAELQRGPSRAGVGQLLVTCEQLLRSLREEQPDCAERLASALLREQERLRASPIYGGEASVRAWNRLCCARATLLVKGERAAKELFRPPRSSSKLLIMRWRRLGLDLGMGR